MGRPVDDTSRMIWVKDHTEDLDDPKLGQLEDSAHLLYYLVNSYAGQLDAEGYLMKDEQPLTANDIAWRLHRESEQCARDLQALTDAGLLTFDQDCWYVTNFAERQGRSQSEKRQAWRERQRDRRSRAAAQPEIVTEDNSIVTHDNSIVTPLEVEVEKEKESTTARGGGETGQERPNIFKLFEANIGMITPVQSEKLKEAEKDYPPEWIECAISEAVVNNKRNWAYVHAILERWRVEGFGTDNRSKARASPNGHKQKPAGVAKSAPAETLEQKKKRVRAEIRSLEGGLTGADVEI